jgi:hypothetical protein
LFSRVDPSTSSPHPHLCLARSLLPRRQETLEALPAPECPTPPPRAALQRLSRCRPPCFRRSRLYELSVTTSPSIRTSSTAKTYLRAAIILCLVELRP